MRLQKKSISRVSLADLLRRKRTNLKKFLSETGIVTYELLTSRCNSMGVVPPSEQEFATAKGSTSPLHDVSSPTEGILVLNPSPGPVVEENLGEAEVETFVDFENAAASNQGENFKKKKKKFQNPASSS